MGEAGEPLHGPAARLRNQAATQDRSYARYEPGRPAQPDRVRAADPPAPVLDPREPLAGARARLCNRVIVNNAALKVPARPLALSTAAPYTSWSSLNDRAWFGRYLPPRGPTELPPIEEVAKLFRVGPAGPRQSARSTLLFPSFAQWFTDGFMMTDDRDRRRTTTSHQIDLGQLYGMTPAATQALRRGSEQPGERGRLKSELIGGEEWAPRLFEAGQRRPEFAALPAPARLPPVWPAEKLAGLFAFGGERANTTPFTGDAQYAVPAGAQPALRAGWSMIIPIGTTGACSRRRATSTSSSSSRSWSRSTSTTSRRSGSTCWPIPPPATRRAGTGRTGSPSSSTCCIAGIAWCLSGCRGRVGCGRSRTCGSTTVRCCTRAWAPRSTMRAIRRRGGSACSTPPIFCCWRSRRASSRDATTSSPATTTTERRCTIPGSRGSSRSATTRASSRRCVGFTAAWTRSSFSSACLPRLPSRGRRCRA